MIKQYCKYYNIQKEFQLDYCSKYKDLIECISFEDNCKRCNLSKDNDGFPCCEKCKDVPEKNFWDILKLIYQFGISEFHYYFVERHYKNE